MNDFERQLRSRFERLRDAIDPPPSLWDRIERPAAGRRWIPVTTGGVAAAVLVFVLIAGVGGHGGGSDRRVSAAGPGPEKPDASTTLPAAGAQAPPTSQAPGTATSGPTTTLRAPSTPTTAPAAPKPTAPLAPTTTAPPPVPTCTVSNLSYAIATDKQSYAPGTSVRVTLIEKNASNRPCSLYLNGCPQTIVRVYAANGTKVWDNGLPPGATACPVPGHTTLQPGQSYATAATWDQRNCPTPAFDESGCSGTQVPPGSYTAHGSWNDTPDSGSYVERATTTFTIT